MGSAGETLDSEQARRRLYDLMRRDIGVNDKAVRALELGSTYLGLEHGHLARIDPATEYWEVVESTDPADGAFPVGLSRALGDTFCRATIRQEGGLSIHDAHEQGWGDHPAVEEKAVAAYVGVAVEAGDAVYGTVCFVDQSPRDEPFTGEESTFADLLARLLGHGIERERYRAELAERQEMIEALCRVFRHNLRNDLMTVQGRTEYVRDRVGDEADDAVETVLETIDEMVYLSDKIQLLNELAAASFDRQEMDVTALVRTVASEVGQASPEATITVEAAADAVIRAAPHLETAFRELIENAVAHTGAEPTVTVDVTATDEAVEVRITDDGPGLPHRERTVLEIGDETPLRHGTGIGLWLVYWIVTRHDGSIDTEVSKLGTSVTVTLPHGPPKPKFTPGV